MPYQVTYTDRCGQPRESQEFGTQERAQEFLDALLLTLPMGDHKCDRRRLAARIVDTSEMEAWAFAE